MTSNLAVNFATGAVGVSCASTQDVTPKVNAASFTTVCQVGLACLSYFWDFTGTAGGNTITDSVSGIAATLDGGATRTSTGVVLSGSSLALQHIALAQITLGGAMTIIGVIKWNAFNHNSRLFGCGGWGTDGIIFKNDGVTGRLEWGGWNGKSMASGSTSDLVIGQWQHIVGTALGTTMNLYINGQAAITKTDSVQPVSKAYSCFLEIGRAHV
jgi:hypothetical protein